MNNQQQLTSQQLLVQQQLRLHQLQYQEQIMKLQHQQHQQQHQQQQQQHQRQHQQQQQLMTQEQLIMTTQQQLLLKQRYHQQQPSVLTQQLLHHQLYQQQQQQHKNHMINSFNREHKDVSAISSNSRKDSNSNSNSNMPSPGLIKNHDFWNEWIRQLTEYALHHDGSTNVPKSGSKSLGGWVHKQRCQYKLYISNKTSQLNLERIQSLDDLGFQWQPRYEQLPKCKKRPRKSNMPSPGPTKNQAIWNEWIRQITDYALHHDGSTNVPQMYASNKALGIWVHKQRYQYKLYKLSKKSQLNLERIQSLNEIGFQWHPRNEQLLKLRKEKEYKSRSRKLHEDEVKEDRVWGNMMKTKKKEEKEEQKYQKAMLSLLSQQHEKKKQIQEHHNTTMMKQKEQVLLSKSAATTSTSIAMYSNNEEELEEPFDDDHDDDQEIFIKCIADDVISNEVSQHSHM